MGAIGYYLFYGISRILTLLPFRVLYIISDIFYLLLYYFPSYRRKVVASNLKNSFPEKTEKELKGIEKKFYKHLADLFIEMIKLSRISQAEHLRRLTITNLGILDKLYEEKRDTIGVIGHYNNWEWLNIIPYFTKYHIISIYKPLQNKFFNKFMNNIRSQHGIALSPMSLIIREIINNRKNNIKMLAAIITDQRPAINEITHWTTFLNQQTPVYMGTEKIASKYDMALVFFNIQKIKRGYYNLNIELLLEHTAGLPQYLITETHVRRLEEIIREKPEYWM